MKVWNFAIKHPVIIAILLVSIIVFGFLSVTHMEKALISQMSMTQVMVFTIYPGASPVVVESEVTNILEAKFASLSGILSIKSESVPSLSIITLELSDKVSLDQTLNEARSIINNSMSFLPNGLDGVPVAMPIGTSTYPIFAAQVDSDMVKSNLTEYINDEVIPLINRIPGVSDASLVGGVNREVRIELDLDLLESREISVIDIYKLLSYNNMTFPAGSVQYKHKNLNVRTEGIFRDIKDIENLVVGYKEDERTFILLKDIAKVNIVDKKQDKYADFAGQQILLLNVTKKDDGDVNKIIDSIKSIFNTVTRDTNGVIKFKPIIDNSLDIDLAINSVNISALLGAILAILVLLFFLHNFKATIIVGVSIPLSIIMAFTLMKLSNITINIMTLGSLTVAIGMMVDGSIVVLENIYTHYLKTGDRKLAASVGTDEVGGAVFASASTSLAVFVPLLFMSGLAGAIFRDISLTICYALGSSTVVALVVVPWLSSLIIKPITLKENKRSILYKRISDIIDGWFLRLTEWYARLIKSVLNNKLFFFSVVIIVLIISILLFGLLGFSLIPSTDMNEFSIRITTPVGFSLEDTRKKVAEIDSLVHKLVPEIESGYFLSGETGGMDILPIPNKAFAAIRVVRPKDRPKVNGRTRSIHDIINVVQKEVPRQITDVNIVVTNGGIDRMISFVNGAGDLSIEIYGPNFDDLIVEAKRVKEFLENDVEVYKTDLNVSLDEFEMVNKLSLQYLNYLGITPFEAGITSRIMFNGMEVGTYRDGKKSYDMNLTSNLSNKEITDDILNKIKVKNQNGDFISFENLSDLEIESAVNKIPHINRMNSVVISAYLYSSDTNKVLNRFRQWEIDNPLNYGVKWKMGGSPEMLNNVIDQMKLIMFIAIYLVYVVMVIQFQKFSQPFLILVSIPFILVGVALSMIFTNTDISLVSLLSIIALFGMVVNNAIVLIDYMNLLRIRYNQTIYEAVINGTKSRLKPILMTTITTILGVIPLAIGKAEGAELTAPLGRVIGGGLISSTLITLLIIPVLYYMLESYKVKKNISKKKV